MATEQLFHVGAKALIRNSQGQVLLLRNRRKNGEDYYDLPGGRLDIGETPEAAVARELQEEAGVTDVTVGKKLGLALTDVMIPLSSGGNARLILTIYVCTIPEDSVFTTEAGTEIGWHEPQDALRDIHGYSDELWHAVKQELGV